MKSQLSAAAKTACNFRGLFLYAIDTVMLYIFTIIDDVKLNILTLLTCGLCWLLFEVDKWPRGARCGLVFVYTHE